ncbi:hypothetical protein KL906_003076 [Ogataea polymorpha]|nr:hypothetical protein KL906_003076 [Ogataea polymorpha]KAG7920968.1 hypothetical protein KL927_000212 [Ogataea polymorpha]
MAQGDEELFIQEPPRAARKESHASFILKAWLALVAPFTFVLNKFIQLLPYHNNRKMSVFTIYIGLMLVFIVPTIFYMDESIFVMSKNKYEVDSEASFRKLQKSHTNDLAYVILPDEKHTEPHAPSKALFDQRVAVAAWLSNLKKHLMDNNGVLDPDFQLPFSWAEWVDLESKLTLDKRHLHLWKSYHPEMQNRTFSDLTCADFRLLYADKDEVLQVCSELSHEERTQYPWYPFSFKITDRTGSELAEAGRILFGASYMLTTAPPPARVHFIGAGLNKSSVVLLTERDAVTHMPISSNRSRDIYSIGAELVSNEARLRGVSVDRVHKDGVRIDNMVSELSTLFNYDTSVQTIYGEDELVFDKSYFLKLDDQVKVMTSLEMTKQDFVYEHEEIMNAMKQRIEKQLETKPDTVVDSLFDHLLLKNIEREMDLFEANGRHKPYLREAYVNNTHLGAHFDWRFFNGIDHPQEYRKAIIHRIGRAWLRFCYQSGFRTFVAYGSMLGWIRNGLTLPWDEDIDVVVSVDSLYKIARNHNQTLIVDVSSEDKYAAGIGSYLLDIGPSFYSRVRGVGANAIDGRMIDTMSGVYVDITAIAWTPDYFSQHNIDDVVRTLVDPEYPSKIDKVKDKDSYREQIDNKARDMQRNHEIYHCRNDNVFRLDELTPMVPTYFEGVRTHVPHKFKQILDRKYPRALQRITEPENQPFRTYKKNLRLWVDDAQCPGNDNDGLLCRDEDVLEEYAHTKEYTARHLELLKHIYDNALSIEDETVPMRYDQFIVRYAQLLNARLE